MTHLYHIMGHIRNSIIIHPSSSQFHHLPLTLPGNQFKYHSGGWSSENYNNSFIAPRCHKQTMKKNHCNFPQEKRRVFPLNPYHKLAFLKMFKYLNKNFYVLTFWKAVKSRQDLLHFLFNLVVLDMRATPS